MVELNNHQKAAVRIKLDRGEDFYRLIGAMGGAKSRGGGFTGDSERARLAGKRGGRPRRHPVTAR